MNLNYVAYSVKKWTIDSIAHAFNRWECMLHYLPKSWFDPCARSLSLDEVTIQPSLALFLDLVLSVTIILDDCYWIIVARLSWYSVKTCCQWYFQLGSWLRCSMNNSWFTGREISNWEAAIIEKIPFFVEIGIVLLGGWLFWIQDLRLIVNVDGDFFSVWVCNKVTGELE